MQLYSFDLQGKLTHARQAKRRTDYQCLECEQTVRLRGGPQRQPHFYHLDPTPFCRQHQKGVVHLHLQSYFFHHLPAGESQLECSFSSIGRIADVAWHSQKIIFEIQCSPISAEEVLARNRDYQQIGWQVIWILHDQRYNQFRLSAAELALRSSPHFFTNMDQLGSGMIYDQFDICDRGLRLKRLSPLPIDICKPVSAESLKELSSSPTRISHKISEKSDDMSRAIYRESARDRYQIDEARTVRDQDRMADRSNSLRVCEKSRLKLIKERMATWTLYFSGDLITSYLQNSEGGYWDQALEMERLFYPSLRPFSWHHIPIQLWQKGIARPYQIFFRFLLERMCR